MSKYYYLTCLVLLPLCGFTQLDPSIRDKVIKVEYAADNELLIQDRLLLITEELDSIDVVVLTSGPILGSLLIEVLMDDREVTFGEIYDRLVEYKHLLGEDYEENKRKSLELRSLMAEPILGRNWEEDRKLFDYIGVRDDEWQLIDSMIQLVDDPSMTYEQFFYSIEDELNELAYEVDEGEVTDLIHIIERSEIIDLDAHLARAKAEEKPVMLYFTGYTCVNCRKLESSVFFEPVVVEVLLEDFILVPIYVDDNTDLPDELIGTEKIEGREYKVSTIGEYNMVFQMREYKVSTQPYLVFLDPNGEQLDEADYMDCKDKYEFLEILDGVLEDMENQ